jgi:polysaccharide deacetylase 2 family uncharacterized protein YibQ
LEAFDLKSNNHDDLNIQKKAEEGFDRISKAIKIYQNVGCLLGDSAKLFRNFGD